MAKKYKLTEADKKAVECWREIEAASKRFDKTYRDIMRFFNS